MNEIIVLLTLIIGLPIALFLFLGFRPIDQTHRGVHLRFGKYKSVKRPGLTWIIPFIDTLKKVDIRERALDLGAQSMMTKDKVSLICDAMVLFKIKGERKDLLTNAAKSVLDVEDIENVMHQKAQAELREIISEKTFSEVLEHRDVIAKKMTLSLDKITDNWGLHVTSVQIKDISLPKTMQRAMAMKAEADIQKQARITKANAEKEAFKIMEKLGTIAKKNPAILELRRIQMINEIGAEQNTTTVIMLPSNISNLLSKIK